MTHVITPTSIIMRLREQLPPEYAKIAEDELRAFWEQERTELFNRAIEARKLANLIDACRSGIEDELYADKREPQIIEVGEPRVTMTLEQAADMLKELNDENINK